MIAYRCIQRGRGTVKGADSLKILIVENDASVRALMGMELRAMGHRETSWATNGRDALVLLKRMPTDLIISAWSMPEMDGPALLKACRQDPGLRHIPFVMMSTRPEHGLQALEAGADAYLIKPFSPNELQEALKRVVSSGQ